MSVDDRVVRDAIESMDDGQLTDLRVALAEGRYGAVPASIPLNGPNWREVARMCDAVAADVWMQRSMTRQGEPE